MVFNTKQDTVHIKNISYTYQNTVVFDNASVVFNASDITAIVGKNGGGKTTLFHLISGILKPQKGIIEHAYKHPMCTFQTPVLLNRTVYDNVLHTAKALKINDAHTATKNALKDVGLYDIKNHPATTLSGGQKMRLQISRMIASNSMLWLLDEPYSGLDMSSAKSLDDIIINAKQKGIKICIVSHNIDVIKRLADSVVEVKDTKIISPISVIAFIKNIPYNFITTKNCSFNI